MLLTWPVMQTTGEESSIAVAMPVTMFVAPGPEVAMATPTPPPGARVAVSHVRGALFVAHQNVVQLGFAERVVDGKNRASRVAKNVADAELGQ